MDKEIQKITGLIRDYNTRNHLWTSSVSASLIRISHQNTDTGKTEEKAFLTVNEIHRHGGWLEIKPPSSGMLPKELQEYVTPYHGWALRDMKITGNTITAHTFDGQDLIITTLI